MTIQSKLARGYWLRKLILTVLFLVFGLWSGYDGLVKYPADNAQYEQYMRMGELRMGQDEHRLTSAEMTELSDLEKVFEDVAETPASHQELDILLQLVLSPIFCLIAVVFVITWLMSARRKYVYHDDGAITAPEGTFTATQMTGLDMARWQSKSIAVLRINTQKSKGESSIKLDAWIYDGMDEIIKALDKRFHPEEYQEKAEKAAAPMVIENADENALEVAKVSEPVSEQDTADMADETTDESSDSVVRE